MVDLPDPIAEGDLDRTPLAHVLAHVATRQITGSIVLWPAEGEQRTGQDRIRVEAGTITAARLVDRQPVLERALMPLLSRAAGPYAVYETIDLVGDSGVSARVDPFALLASALRADSRDDAVERVLGQLEGRTLRLRGAAELKRFGFLPKEERFIEIMRAGPGTPEELLRSCELGPLFGKRLLYMLVLTKFLEPYDAPPARVSQPSPEPRAAGASISGEMRVSQLPLPPATSTPPAPVAPSASTSGSLRPPTALRFKAAPALPPDPPTSGLAPDQLALWKEVIERSRVLETQNYYDMLGVARNAGTDAVRKEYFALAKRWHPDRIAGALLPIKPFVERIFGYLTSAQDTLTDEKKRAEYLRNVQDGGGTPEADRKLGLILAAAMEHQKAEVLIRRRDFEGARVILEGALELNAEEADVLASLAWTLFHLPNESVARMLATAERALRIVPAHDRAHYARGMILRRMGNETEAMAAFRAAADANPKNIDAVREVRLADMRAGQAPQAAKRSGSSPRPPGSPATPPASDGGFLSKLFGSPKKK